jgi:stress response protein YsnF
MVWTIGLMIPSRATSIDPRERTDRLLEENRPGSRDWVQDFKMNVKQHIAVFRRDFKINVKRHSMVFRRRNAPIDNN